MYRFTNETMLEIFNYLDNELKHKDRLSFEILNPDNYKSIYAGTVIEIEQKNYLYRSYKSWFDLANKLFCRVLTPILVDEHIVKLTFEKLNSKSSFHKEKQSIEQKYGTGSIFSQISKNEEPDFLISYLQSLQNVKIDKRKRVLNLGVNSADEFELIKNISDEFENIEFVGIDYCNTAIENANEKFKNSNNVTFICHDINKLEQLNLGEFDLIISIGTLQSTNLNFNEILMNIVQNYLKKDGSMILGFPNCRWIDGEMIYGAKAPNYSFSEMSLVLKDILFTKKYLQQKKFRVTITGHYYLFLTATSIRK